MRFFRFLKRPLFWVVLVIVVLALIVTAHVLAPPPPPQYLTDTVREMTLKRTVLATGELYASEMVEVGAQASGEIKKIDVVLGQQVKKGQLIAEIDSDKQQNDLEINQARLKSALAQQKSAQTHLQMVQLQYDRLKKLYAQGAISQQQLDAASDTQAQATFALSQANAAVTQLTIDIRQNKIDIAHTRIVAPMDGVVVSIWVNAGQTVSAFNQVPTIAQVANLDTMLNRFRISEADISEVKVGQTIVVRSLSSTVPPVQSKVSSVDPGLTYLTQGRFTNNTETTNGAIYYYGRALVPNPKHQYRIGMTTQNEILIAQGKGLTVPNPAIRWTPKGQAYVEVMNPATRQLKAVTVTLGLSDGIRTIVTHSTLKANDVVVTGVVNDPHANTYENSGF